MNGRIYDPELGRMLSPDPVVQVPEFSQNFNRYSYVLNNPLNMTDPTGFSWLSKAFHKVGHWLSQNWRTVASIVVAVALWWTPLGPWAATTLLGPTLAASTAFTVGGMAVTYGTLAAEAVCGAVMSAFNSAINGGDLGDVLRGAAVGAIQGAIAGGLLHGMEAGAVGVMDKAIHIAGHGILGGAANAAMGGKFQDGFLSAAAAAYAGWTVMKNTAISNSIGSTVLGRTMIAGIVGGTASALGGGKFANGAWTAAFQHLLNAEVGKVSKGVLSGLGNGLNKASRTPLGYLWSLPNTAIGLVWGGVGLLAEAIMLPFKRQWDIRISLGHNAIEFQGHNLAGTAETLGNTISYASGYSPEVFNEVEGHTIGQHERMHTYQGQQIGPLYLPAVVASYGLDLLMSGPQGQFHGSWSFIERGPQTFGRNRTWNFSKSYINPYQ